MKAQALALVRGLGLLGLLSPPVAPHPWGCGEEKSSLKPHVQRLAGFVPCWAARDPQAGQGLVRPSAGLWEARGRPCCCESTWCGLLSLHGWERTLVAPPCFRPGAQDKGPRSQGGLP